MFIPCITCQQIKTVGSTSSMCMSCEQNENTIDRLQKENVHLKTKVGQLYEEIYDYQGRLSGLEKGNA